MTLNNDDELLKKLNVPSLKAALPESFPEILLLIPEMSNELRIKVLDQVPGFMQFSLDSMKTLEETLQTTAAAIGSEQKQLHDSFADLRRILAERLQTPGISESHAEFVIDKMIEMQREEKGQSNDANKLIAEQADATRLSKMLDVALPLVVTAIAAGAQIAINRRSSAGFKI
jgi:hypothetical protein